MCLEFNIFDINGNLISRLSLWRGCKKEGRYKFKVKSKCVLPLPVNGQEGGRNTLHSNNLKCLLLIVGPLSTNTIVARSVDFVMELSSFFSFLPLYS